MDVLDDLEFLRQDNANLLKEIQSLRLHTTLLRERSQQLEQRLREETYGHKEPNSNVSEFCLGYKLFGSRMGVAESLAVDTSRWTIPKLTLDTQIGDVQITEGTLKPQESHIPNRSSGLTWFDDSPIQPTTHPFVEELTRFEIPEENPSQSIRVPRMDDPPIRGSRLIGEAPITKTTPEMQVKEIPVHPSTVTPPSPNPSEREKKIPLPSLFSVSFGPVTGVALPHVALSLLELKLIQKEVYDTPAAVASFMYKLTHTEHPPQSTYRAAFTAAFATLIPLLGTLSAEWLTFLHDFPSRIPASKRDSIVSIPWPQSGITIPELSTEDLRINIKEEPPRPERKTTISTRRRSKSFDDGTLDPQQLRFSFISVAGKGQTHVIPIQSTPTATGCPPCERDAWVLLLALAFAAFPTSRVAKKMKKLPVTVKMQMIPWLPPAINVYHNMSFASTTVDEALGQLWDAKKEILRLRHGWP